MPACPYCFGSGMIVVYKEIARDEKTVTVKKKGKLARIVTDRDLVKCQTSKPPNRSGSAWRRNCRKNRRQYLCTEMAAVALLEFLM